MHLVPTAYSCAAGGLLGTERPPSQRPPGLDWSLEPDSDPVLVLRGEIDASTADELDAALTALTREPRERMFVDLGEVTFLDSTAVHAFMQAHQTAQGDDRRLVFRGPLQTPVAKVFDLMGLADILDIDPR